MCHVSAHITAVVARVVQAAPSFLELDPIQTTSSCVYMSRYCCILTDERKRRDKIACIVSITSHHSSEFAEELTLRLRNYVYSYKVKR
jgi:hypothetical protein